MVNFSLKQDNQNYFKLSVHSRETPTAWDTWDGNRLRTRVHYAFPGGVDSYSASLFTTDLESFRDELMGDVVGENGLMALTTIDGVITITMERLASGVAVECNLRKVPDGPPHAHLTFRIATSEVFRIVQELDSILMQYPVIRPGRTDDPGNLEPPSRN